MESIIIIFDNNDDEKKALSWLKKNKLPYTVIGNKNIEELSKLLLSYKEYIPELLNKKHKKYDEIMNNLSNITYDDLANMVVEDNSLFNTPILYNIRDIVIGFDSKIWNQKILEPLLDKVENYLGKYNKSEYIIPYHDGTQHYECNLYRNMIQKYNSLDFSDDFNRFKLKKSIFGYVGDSTEITAPFYSSGSSKNIFIGDNSFVNSNVTFVDDGKIFIGNKCFIGPNVELYTINHPLSCEERSKEYTIAKDIMINDNVWIGGGSIILPGVEIGKNSVIGAGSVVTHDIPSNVVAYGNPCRVIRYNKERRNKQNMVVAMSCNENWYKYLVVNVFSLLKFNSHIRKIVLFLETDNIDEVKYLKEIRDYFNAEIQLINFNNICDNYLDESSPNRGSMFSNYSFARLILADYIDEDKALYIDSDAIVRGDLSHLWDFDLKDNYLLGVKDYGVTFDNHLESLNLSGRYVNSGVVLFNLKKIREEKTINKWFDIINNKKLKYPDQDALNIVCTDYEEYLPSVYNYISGVTMEAVNKDLIKIFHYAGYKYDWVADRINGEEWYDSEEMFYNEIVNYLDEN